MPTPPETDVAVAAEGGAGTPEVAALDAARLVAAVPEPVFVADREGRVLLANDAAETLLGLHPGGAMEPALTRRLPPDETRALLTSLREVADRGVSRRARLHPRGATGELTAVALSLAAVRDSTGCVTGVVGLGHGTGELERAQTELQEKVVDLERFEEVVVGRELKMIGLERELEAARCELERLRAQPARAG
ncbi:MAG TPA: PAS domain-containing protein [Methylomirabilota bacterium]|nr:PAS domain-containing protein [Methylomirabilota bacterium]